MPRWRFLVALHKGAAKQRQQTCEEIKRLVQMQRLSASLPMVKYEEGLGREFYLGLAIVGPKGSQRAAELEDAARDVLVSAGVESAGRRDKSFLLDAADASFLHGTVGCESFTQPITFEPASDPDGSLTTDPLAEVDLNVFPSRDSTSAEAEQYERLLLWCTAIGSGELIHLRSCAQALAALQDGNSAWPLLRRLVLLGHLEFDGGSRFRWAIIPPTLVTSGADCNQKFLAGQRPGILLQRMRERFGAEVHPQPLAPARVLVRATAGDVVDQTGFNCLDAGCASQKMSERLPTLDDWMLRLPRWDERDFSRFETERYDVESGEFHRISTKSVASNTGFYRFSLDSAARGSSTLAYHDEQVGHWVCGDYYGLKFLARSRGGQCRALYRENSLQLATPLIDRWPMPYERALVLASGALPHLVQNRGLSILLYQGITPGLAKHLCGLLGLPWEVASV